MSSEKHVLGPKAKDLTKEPPFGRLTVIAFAGSTKYGAKLWLCRCDCGTEKTVLGMALTSGQTKSCGCLQVEMNRKRSTKHGQATREASSREYAAWSNIKGRATNPNNEAYGRYGGAGKTICFRWRNSFEAFYADMGQRPSDKHSVDRIDGTKGYYCGKCDECIANGWPANCRWATDKEQAINRKTTRFITYAGKTQCMEDWATELRMHPADILRRIQRGWTIEKALTTPIRALPKRKRAA